MAKKDKKKNNGSGVITSIVIVAVIILIILGISLLSKKNKKIEIINNTNTMKINGNKFVQEIILDKPYKGNKKLKVDAVFVAIGHIALSDLAKKIGVKTDEKGEIILNHKTSETNIPGVFAAGDVTDKQFKQLITGVADGCTAAYSAYEYINN